MMGRVSSPRHTIYMTRAAVFCAHQSVHTIAQSRQETLNNNSIPFWSRDNPVMDGQVDGAQQTENGHSIGVDVAVGRPDCLRFSMS